MPKYRLIYEVTAPNENIAVYNLAGPTNAGYDKFKMQKIQGARPRHLWRIFKNGYAMGAPRRTKTGVLAEIAMYKKNERTHGIKNIYTIQEA